MDLGLTLILHDLILIWLFLQDTVSKQGHSHRHQDLRLEYIIWGNTIYLTLQVPTEFWDKGGFGLFLREVWWNS